MFYGYQPAYQNGKPVNCLAGLETWAGVKCPVYLIAGEADHLVPAADMQKIVEAIKGNPPRSPEAGEALAPAAAAPADLALGHDRRIPQTIGDIGEEDFLKAKRNPQSDGQDDPSDDPSTPQEHLADVPAQPRHPRKSVQSTILPAPANHTCLYMPRHSRAIAGLISDFLASKVTGRLSLAWQLQYLSKEGKWDVKNLNKWKSVQPVSEPIGPADAPIFRAMKTLREADEVHTPQAFTSTWSGTITDVVDISKDQPVYDPRGLERGGIHYHKFPTVSKVPPQAEEIDAFIKLIDSIRARRKEEGATGLIGVHCHYGFNRTGYFIVCYLVERCGMTVNESIETFARARPNGIRHSHFLDRLYVRYNVDGVGTGTGQ
jgi:protein-tyrosine phosphatase